MFALNLETSMDFCENIIKQYPTIDLTIETDTRVAILRIEAAPPAALWSANRQFLQPL
jgi:hypothetical protein